jgi:predicted S18 family serine protease
LSHFGKIGYVVETQPPLPLLPTSYCQFAKQNADNTQQNILFFYWCVKAQLPNQTHAKEKHRYSRHSQLAIIVATHKPQLPNQTHAKEKHLFKMNGLSPEMVISTAK